MMTTSVMPKISTYQYDSSTGKYDWGVTLVSGEKPFITNTRKILLNIN
jgi:hypothetical protein